MGKAVTKASRTRAKERVARVTRAQRQAADQRRIIEREAQKEPLPLTFQGAKVVRGEGMRSDDLDQLLEREALDNFSHRRGEPLFLVVEDKALEDLDDSTQISGFADEQVAITVAKARSCGNVDHRVLKVVEQTLVVATMNRL